MGTAALWLASLATVVWAQETPGDTLPRAEGSEYSRMWRIGTDEDETGVEIQCIGNPPDFRLHLYSLTEKPPWAGEEARLEGLVRIGEREARTSFWHPQRDDLITVLSTTDMEAYARAGGEIELTVELTNLTTFRLTQTYSEEVKASIDPWLETCGSLIKDVDRHFEVDGIQVDLWYDVDDEGLLDIRTLAREHGIDDVESIYVGLHGVVVSSPVAIVRSIPVVSGRKITQSELMLRNKNWASSWIHPDENVTSRGEWETSSEYLYSLDRWMIQDGAWSIEARLGDGVDYEVAAKILRAIREETLVDKRFAHIPKDVRERLGLGLGRERPDSFMNPAVPGASAVRRLDESTLPRIELDDEEEEDAAAGGVRYEVTLPQTRHWTLRVFVRVVGDSVELVGLSSSVA